MAQLVARQVHVLEVVGSSPIPATMSHKKNNITSNLAFAMTERPRVFQVNGMPFFIYPTTLGMLQVVKPLIEDLSQDEELSRESELLEIMRICEDDKRKVAILIAYRTCNGYAEVCDVEAVERKADKLMELDSVAMAEILIMILGELACDTEEYEEVLGITEQRKLMKRTIEIKDNKDSSTVSFGAVSIYGGFIGHFCKEYGWSYQYVMWGVSYVNLKLLLADEKVDIYLTDEERKRSPIPRKGEDVVDLTDKAQADKYLHCFD